MIPTDKETFEILGREKKYRIRIRPDKNDPKYVTEMVKVNGQCIQIPVGEDIDVPETVYRCLEAKGII